MTGAVWSDVSEQQRLSYSPGRTQPRAVQMLQLLGVSKKTLLLLYFIYYSELLLTVLF